MPHLQHVHFTEDSDTLDLGIRVLEPPVLEPPVLEPLVSELLVLEHLVSEPRITINKRETALGLFFYVVRFFKGKLINKANRIKRQHYIEEV